MRRRLLLWRRLHWHCMQRLHWHCMQRRLLLCRWRLAGCVLVVLHGVVMVGQGVLLGEGWVLLLLMRGVLVVAHRRRWRSM